MINDSFIYEAVLQTIVFIQRLAQDQVSAKMPLSLEAPLSKGLASLVQRLRELVALLALI